MRTRVRIRSVPMELRCARARCATLRGDATTRLRASCLALLLGASCGSSAPPSAGGLGQPCRPGGSCDPGLACLLERCVRGFEAGPPPPDGFRPPDRPLAGPDADSSDRALVDLARPKLDQPTKLDQLTPKLDQPKSKPDQGRPPSCAAWSAWSCIASPKAGLACWATCGSGPALWCTSTGSCTCTSSATPCASGLAVSMGSPCATCEAAFVSKGCCH